MNGPSTVFQDVSNIARAVTPWVMAKTECNEISAYYRNRYVIKVLLYFPEAIYRYTLMYLACVAYKVAQTVGYREGMYTAAYWAKQCAVSLAQGSFNTTVYQIGWGLPRVGIVINSLSRLWIKGFQLQNSFQYQWGDSCVDKGELPIDPNAVKAAIICRIHRVYSLVMIAITGRQFVRDIAKAALPQSIKNRLDNALFHAGRFVASKLELPAYELWIVGPGLTQNVMLWSALLVDRVARMEYMRQLLYKAFGLQ